MRPWTWLHHSRLRTQFLPHNKHTPLQYGLHNFIHRSVQSVQVAFLNEVNRSYGRCAIPRNTKIGKQLLSEYFQNNSDLRINIKSLRTVFTFAFQNSMEQSSCCECRRRSSLSSAYESRRFCTKSTRDHQWTYTFQLTLPLLTLSQYNQTCVSFFIAGKYVRFILKITDFCHVTPCGLIEMYWGSGKYTGSICPEVGSGILPFSGTRAKFC